MYYYAQLDENSIITGVLESEFEIPVNDLVSKYLIAISSPDYNLTGKVYRNGQFMTIELRTMLLLEEVFATVR